MQLITYLQLEDGREFVRTCDIAQRYNSVGERIYNDEPHQGLTYTSQTIYAIDTMGELVDGIAKHEIPGAVYLEVVTDITVPYSALLIYLKNKCLVKSGMTNSTFMQLRKECRLQLRKECRSDR